MLKNKKADWLRAGAHVEASGDPEVAGWEDSWWTAVVVKVERVGFKRMVTVRYDELLEDDGVTKSEEALPAARVRPVCQDDSSLPLAQRQPGEPVDCWHDDGWWEGYVHRVFDDHITVLFPRTGEEYEDIFPTTRPLDPDAHRVRSGRIWDRSKDVWVPRPFKAYPGAGNFRRKTAAAPVAGAAGVAGARGAATASGAAAAGRGQAVGGPPHANVIPISDDEESEDELLPLVARHSSKPKQQQKQQREPAAAPAVAQQPSKQQAVQQKAQRQQQPAVAKPPSQQQPPAAKAPLQQQQLQWRPSTGQIGAAGSAEGSVSGLFLSDVHAANDDIGALLASLDTGGDPDEPQLSPPAQTELMPTPQAVGAGAPGAAAGLGAGVLSKAEAQTARVKRPQDVQQQQQPQQQRQRQPARPQPLNKAAVPATAAAKAAAAAEPPVAAAAGRQQGEQQADKARPKLLAKHPRSGEVRPGTGGCSGIAGGGGGSQPGGKGSSKRGGGLFIIPKRQTLPNEPAEPGSAFTPAASPRQQQPDSATGAAAAARAAGAGAAAAAAEPRRRRSVAAAAADAAATVLGELQSFGQDQHPAAHKRRREEPAERTGLAAAAAAASAPRRGSMMAAAAAAAGVQESQDKDDGGGFPTVFCLDNLGAGMSSAALQEGLASIGVEGLESVEVVSVPLDAGDRMAGYAVLRFRTPAHARQQWDRLRSVCIVTSTCPVPRPLIVHDPRFKEGYSWGPDPRLPGHFPLDYAANQHFAQPNSIEFDLAIEWRQLLGVLSHAKHALCCEQAAELAEQMAAYLKETGKGKPPAIKPDRLKLPGEGGGTRGKGAAAAAATPDTCCVWLSGVPVSITEQDLVEAFFQFGFPQKAQLVLDPVTRRPSGHAVLWMESEERAKELVQNLREMVYMLNGTPRAVHAELADPGMPRGSQSVYDRALRCVFGKDDSSCQLSGSSADGCIKFVEIPDLLVLQTPQADGSGGMTPEQRAAIALRRLLRSHFKEQSDLVREQQERQQQLDAKQQQHFRDEKLKLGRLAHIQYQPAPGGGARSLMEHLLQLHGLNHMRVYRNKDAARLAREAAEERRRRLHQQQHQHS